MSEDKINQPAIRVECLSKHYGKVKAIDDLSFSLKRGHVCGFLGPNGAGKSTTMRILCGLLRASSGRAYVGGVSVAREPMEVKRKIGYMPENNPLPEDMRVLEYLTLRAHLKEIQGRAVSKAVDEAMDVCDLNRTARKRIIGSLSKGFRQRVGIADAILAKPEIIIMDEPTIGLDPHQVIGIRKLIRRLRGEMTLLLSSHILSEMERSCDSIIIMNQGRIVASGAPNALREEFAPTQRLRVKVQGAPELFKENLLMIAPKAKVVESHAINRAEGAMEFIIEMAKPDNLSSKLISTLANHKKLRLLEIAQLNASLEDVFIAATRRGWDELTTIKIAPYSARA